VCLAGLVPACSSSHDDQPASDGGTTSDADTIGCLNDKRADTYTANLAKAASSQKLKVTLVSGDPAPPIRGVNHWTVKVVDESGAPVTAPLTVKPFMPDHGHGSSTQPVVTSKGDGTYDVADLNFFMPGLWQITFSTNTSPADSVVYSFCISG